jgi:hypothetical protein
MLGKHLQLLIIRSKSVLLNKERNLQVQNSTLNKYNETQREIIHNNVNKQTKK